MVKHNRKSQSSAKLPPGSMGWPYIGETLDLYSQNPNVFFATKQKRFFNLSLLNVLSSLVLFLALGFMLHGLKWGVPFFFFYVAMERYSRPICLDVLV